MPMADLLPGAGTGYKMKQAIYIGPWRICGSRGNQMRSGDFGARRRINTGAIFILRGILQNLAQESNGRRRSTLARYLFADCKGIYTHFSLRALWLRRQISGDH